MYVRHFATAAVVAASLAYAGCSSGAGSRAANPGSYLPSISESVAHAGGSPGTYIKHVVIIVQEQRSFDNIFAGYPGADAKTVGELSTGKHVRLHQITFTSTNKLGYIGLDYDTAHASVNGGLMNQFNLEDVIGTKTGHAGTAVFARLEQSEVAPYWTMAQQYTLADHMFPTMLGPDFTGHLDLIAGTSDLTPVRSEVNSPSGTTYGCDAKKGTTSQTLNTSLQIDVLGPFPCFTQFKTMADTLDAAHVPWKYYVQSLSSTDKSGRQWNAFDAIKGVRDGADWHRSISSPETNILLNAAQGKLPGVSWVIPEVVNSDVLGSGSDTGPSWVASVVNAIGQSPDWKSTAIVVVYDDWGGWYDDLAPPPFDFRGLGIRVPCIIISPWAKHGYVSHTIYESGSILKFIEQVFNLPALGPTAKGYTDTRANSLIDSFDFTQTPPKFQPIAAKYSPSYFLNQGPASR